MLQSVLAGMVVALCIAHVTWRLLLPARWRQHMAARLQHRTLPSSPATRYESPTRADRGCACEGCGARNTAQVQIIRMPRGPRR